MHRNHTQYRSTQPKSSNAEQIHKFEFRACVCCCRAHCDIARTSIYLLHFMKHWNCVHILTAIGSHTRHSRIFARSIGTVVRECEHIDVSVLRVCDANRYSSGRSRWNHDGDDDDNDDDTTIHLIRLFRALLLLARSFAGCMPCMCAVYRSIDSNKFMFGRLFYGL